MATDAQVAEWMVRRLKRDGHLFQEDAVDEIEQRFGKKHVYENENGNPAISRKVLREFRKRTEKDVVWERGERMCVLARRATRPGVRQTDRGRYRTPKRLRARPQSVYDPQKNEFLGTCTNQQDAIADADSIAGLDHFSGTIEVHELDEDDTRLVNPVLVYSRRA